MYAPSPENVTRRLLRTVLDVLLPAPCLACGTTLREPRRSLGLCGPCRGRLERWPRNACGGCGRILGDTCRLGEEDPPSSARCDACRRKPPPFDRLLSAWSYQPPLDAVLAGLKFRRLEYLGAQLGRAVAELLWAELDDCDLVVPVPLHWRRHLRRGYNQAAAIARPVATHLGRPLASLLRRRRATPAQSRLSRADRRRNLRGAFAIRALAMRPAASRVAGHVLLVDDVVTTGATLRDAAACLRRAGAAAVTALTVARTPEPT